MTRCSRPRENERYDILALSVCVNIVSSSTDPEVEVATPSVQKLSSDLRPLMFWMSNATELLNFFQVKVEAMEKEWEFEGEGDVCL